MNSQKNPLGRQNFKIVVVLGLVGALSVGYFYYRDWKHHGHGQVPAAHDADYLALKGENTLLKKMLGQVEGDVVVLGPVGNAGKTSGKLVWDRTLQGGFVHVNSLPDSHATYSLWAAESADKLVFCGIFTPDERELIQAPFKAEQPVYKAHIFLLTAGRDTTAVVAKGLLP